MKQKDANRRSLATVVKLVSCSILIVDMLVCLIFFFDAFPAEKFLETIFGVSCMVGMYSFLILYGAGYGPWQTDYELFGY